VAAGVARPAGCAERATPPADPTAEPTAEPVAPDATRPREALDPQPAAYLRRALLLVDRPRPEDQTEARRLLLKVIKAEPGSAQAYLTLARSSVYLYSLALDQTPERLRSALSEARRAVELAPDSPGAHAALASALAISNALTPARAEAQRAVELGPDDVAGPLALCIIERQRLDVEAALASCRRAAALQPDAPRVLVALAEALRESGDQGGAMRMFGQAADLDHESVLPQLGAAAALTRSSNWSRAAKAYDVVLDKFSFARARALQGAAAMKALAGEYETALTFLDQVELPEDDALPTLLSLYTRGYALLHLDRAPEAEYFLSTLLARVPNDYDGPARGREVLFRSYGDLIDYFEKQDRQGRVDALLKEACARPMAPLKLARRRADRLTRAGNRDQAARALEEALAGADPREESIERADTALLLARLRSDGGRHAISAGTEAGRALDQVAASLPAQAPGAAHYRMARAFALAGDRDRSLACLESARAAGYLPADQAASEPDLESLRRLPRFQQLLGSETGARVD
jgi:tetratricopeptide (TPR) repeat protein